MNAPAPPAGAAAAIATLQAVAARALDAQRDAMTATAGIELAHLRDLPEASQTRALVALTLLKASCDMGLAVSTLLATSLLDLAAAALALHRTQIETYARGVFFKSAATDHDVKRFVQQDEMPKRRRANGKSTTVTTAEVLRAAAEAEGMDASKLQSMLDNVWRGLCGVVHGGRHLLHTYGAVGTIGVRFDESSVRALLSNTGAFTVLACTTICAIGDSGADQQEVLTRIRAAAGTITTAVDLLIPGAAIACESELERRK